MSKTKFTNARCMRSVIIKTDTNDGDPTKQYVKIWATDQSRPSIVITRLSLTSTPDEYREIGHELLRTFKGVYLFRQIFAFRVDTLRAFNAVAFGDPRGVGFPEFSAALAEYMQVGVGELDISEATTIYNKWFK